MSNCDFESYRFKSYYLPILYYIKYTNFLKNKKEIKKVIFYKKLINYLNKNLFIFNNYNLLKIKKNKTLNLYIFKKTIFKCLNLIFFNFNFKIAQFFINIDFYKKKLFFSLKMLLNFFKIKNKKNYSLILTNFLKKKISFKQNTFCFIKINGLKKEYQIFSKIIKIFFFKNQKNVLIK